MDKLEHNDTANHNLNATSATAELALVMEGRTLAKELRATIKTQVAEFTTLTGIQPGLAVLLIGDDPSSIAYSRTLVKTANDLGFYARHLVYPAHTTPEEFTDIIAELNSNPAVHGISLQWPTPPQLSLEIVTSVLDPRKDVEGYHPLLTGRLYAGLDTFVPATPKGGLRLLAHYGFTLEGKSVLLIGSGVTVGKPLLALLLNAKASPMIVNKFTPKAVLKNFALQSDIIFLAAGSPGILTADMVSPGAVVVDFGTTVIDDNLVGDADYNGLLPVVKAITPTPGGTGPMTNVMLLENVLKAARQQVLTSVSD